MIINVRARAKCGRNKAADFRRRPAEIPRNLIIKRGCLATSFAQGTASLSRFRVRFGIKRERPLLLDFLITRYRPRIYVERINTQWLAREIRESRVYVRRAFYCERKSFIHRPAGCLREILESPSRSLCCCKAFHIASSGVIPEIRRGFLILIVSDRRFVFDLSCFFSAAYHHPCSTYSFT